MFYHLYVGASSFYEKHHDITLADSNNRIINIEKLNRTLNC